MPAGAPAPAGHGHRRPLQGRTGEWGAIVDEHSLGLVLHLRRAFTEMPPRYAYGALAGVLLIEGTGLPLVPFEPLFIATAVLVAQHRLGFWPLVVYAAAGDLLGNLVGYHIGRTVGQILLDRYGARLHFDAARVARTREWFWRFGGGTLFIARFFGPIRTPAILLAGLTRMPLPTYAIWCGVADVLWVAGWQLLLLRFGRLAPALWRRFGHPAAGFAFLALTAAACVLIYWLWKGKGGARSA